MTLIAAIRSDNIPFLIGDFLITRGDMQAGIRKKVYILSDNFCAGWTGDAIAASNIIGSLREFAKTNAISQNSLRDFLTTNHKSGFGKLQTTIIGWVIDGSGQSAFRWNSDYPCEVYFGEPMYDGCADEFCNYFFGSSTIENNFKKDYEDTIDSAIISVLQRLILLNSPEITGPSLFDQGHKFGFAYEIIYHNGKKFIYVDSVIYCAIGITYDSNGTVEKIETFGKVCNYLAGDDISILTIYDRNIGKTHCYAISSIDIPVKMPEEILNRMMVEVTKSKKLNTCSNYYALFIHLKSPGMINTPAMVVVPRIYALNQNSPIRINERDGIMEFTFTDWFLEAFYKIMRENPEGEGGPIPLRFTIKE